MLCVGDTLAVRTKLFRSLGDPSRLALLDELRAGPRNVTELAERTGLSQPNTSMHLACLRDCGLIVGESRGRYVVYSLAEPCLADLLDAAEHLLEHVGERVYACTRPPMVSHER